MSDLPSLPLFVDDYEAAAAHLSLEEDGAYSRLLRLCWRTPGCSVPDEPAWIARKLRVSLDDFQRVVAPLIDEFFTRSGGRIFQKRLRQEFSYVTSVSAARKKAGKRGGLAKSSKNNDNGGSKATDLPEPSDKQNATFAKAPTPTLTPTPIIDDDDEARARELLPIKDWPGDLIAITDELCRTGGVGNNQPGHIIANQQVVKRWLDDGFDPPNEIAPAIRQALADTTERISSLKYFDAPVRQAKARKEAAANGHSAARQKPRSVLDGLWDDDPAADSQADRGPGDALPQDGKHVH